MILAAIEIEQNNCPKKPKFCTHLRIDYVDPAHTIKFYIYIFIKQKTCIPAYYDYRHLKLLTVQLYYHADPVTIS